MTIQRMDNVGVVVDDLEAAVAFFLELGLELAGEAAVEGRWVDPRRRARRCPSRHRNGADSGRPRTARADEVPHAEAISAEPNAPANTLGIRRIMFAVEDIEDVLARLHAQGAELVGEIQQYEDSYRLCYVRGPERIIVALAEQLS